ASPVGEERLACATSYFLGNDPSKWRADVGSFARVRSRGVAPGVDLVWRGTRRALEYDLVVAPGGDVAAFAMEIEGACSAKVDAATGDLVVATPHGAFRHSRPVCFQTIDGRRQDVAGRFVVAGARVSFAVGEYDHTRELVVDPQVAYSAAVGGSSSDAAQAVAFGPTG